MKDKLKILIIPLRSSERASVSGSSGQFFSTTWHAENILSLSKYFSSTSQLARACINGASSQALKENILLFNFSFDGSKNNGLLKHLLNKTHISRLGWLINKHMTTG